MKIYIIEDNFFQREYLQMLIEDLLLEQNYDYLLEIITDFRTFNDDLSHISISNGDIFFIDIDLKSMVTGIDIASTIRESNPHCYIIFITDNPSKVMEIINQQIKPFQYLVKENNFQIALKKSISTLFLNINKVNQFLARSELNIDLNLEQYFFLTEDVNYISSIKTDRFSCYLHKVHDTKIIGTSIGHLKKQINDPVFFKGFRQYIINTNNIEKIYRSNGEITFRNSEVLHLSPRMINKILEYIKRR
ncbi:LytR/AlgR family response regulator transcription factor [Listeria booriae]|uniref:LytR/AlgR family response regulator transcription factor n=1 Tax=Listeria booriae TaxID=1552123 RepID=UPI0021AD6222|nr:DNA-binding response regulator [Listeria booriae]